MCKSEIFAKIIALVSKGTEIPTELIVSDNRVTEIVNARYIPCIYSIRKRILSISDFFSHS